MKGLKWISKFPKLKQNNNNTVIIFCNQYTLSTVMPIQFISMEKILFSIVCIWKWEICSYLGKHVKYFSIYKSIVITFDINFYFFSTFKRQPELFVLDLLLASLTHSYKVTLPLVISEGTWLLYYIRPVSAAGTC